MNAPSKWNGRRTSDPRKLSVHLPPEALAEIRAVASRLNRSISYVTKLAWNMAREEMRRMPAPGTLR